MFAIESLIWEAWLPRFSPYKMVKTSWRGYWILLVLSWMLGICFSFLGVMWIGDELGVGKRSFISGQFYSNSVTFANSIHVGMANSESSLCSVFIVKFWWGNIMSFLFLPNSWSSFVYLNSFLEFFCLLEFLIAWGWLSTHSVWNIYWNIYWHARWGKEGTLKLVLECHSGVSWC